MKLPCSWFLNNSLAGMRRLRPSLTSSIITRTKKTARISTRLVGGVKEHADELDSEISACLRGWTLARLSRVDLAIMRLAVYEMQYTGLPAAVAINEAVELTRKYSGEESCPFVNGVLGSISRKLAAQA